MAAESETRFQGKKFFKEVLSGERSQLTCISGKVPQTVSHSSAKEL
jgi:hypothetical protein